MAFTKVTTGGLSQTSNYKTHNVNSTGIITAVKFVGDGSDLDGVSSAGIGSALDEDNTKPLNLVYYTNSVLGIGSTMVVNHPNTATAAYTAYTDIKLEGEADLIVEDGDDLILDVLGISSEGVPEISGSGGRVRAGEFTNTAGTGSPSFPQGVRVTGVATATTLDSTTVKVGTAVTISSGIITATSLSSSTVTASGTITADGFSGSGQSLTNIPGANITGTIPLAALGNAPTQASVDTLTANVAVLGFKIAVNGSLSKYSLVDQIIDEYADATGIDASASTNEEVGGTGANKYYYGGTGGTTTYNTTYNYTGSDVTIATQNGGSVTGTVKLWGAAGGQDSSSSGSNHFGGGGSFVSATFNWTSDGSNLIFSVGQGGIKGQKNGSAGNGGGYTGIFKGSKTQANALLIAAGGGGAGDAGGDYGAPGGNFSAGVRGGGTDAGYGASSSAGGAAGGNSGNHPATAGGALAGGHGGSHEARQQSASYNGGGIQGQEPGGVMGGGGGGGGYWGGGGGANGNHGAGGGSGVSFYQSSGSYWQGTPTAEGGNDYNAGGDDDSDYPANIGKGGHTTSEIDGGHGAIVPNITVSTVVSGGNLVLQSNASTASSAPTKGDLVLLIEDAGSGTSTLNTDIKGYISRDNGTNFTQGTLIDEGSWGTNKKIVAFHNLDISGQPSGTSMKYKITTHNQHSTSKITRIHATSLGWK